MMVAQQPVPVGMLLNPLLTPTGAGWLLEPRGNSVGYVGGGFGFVFGSASNSTPLARVSQVVDLMPGQRWNLSYVVGQGGVNGNPQMTLEVIDVASSVVLYANTTPPGAQTAVFASRGPALIRWTDASTGDMSSHDVYLNGPIVLSPIV